MNLKTSKKQIDLIIKKARVHLYKPIQIAEILYRSRVVGDINLEDLQTYRTQSRRWRDDICVKFLGQTSTSSARFQDNLFEANAVPPEAIATLGAANRHDGAVEAYIYSAFRERQSQMTNGLDLVTRSNKATFSLEEFIGSFRRTAGLSRSVDKIFEIIVYALFSTILNSLNVQINLKITRNNDVLEDFSDFTEKVLGLTTETPELQHKPQVYRVGVTNAADRGLDMWANFGLAIQIKHLSLTANMVDDISSGIQADRILIVCKDCDRDTLVSVLRQFGAGGRIQSVITESELITWYERALRGRCADKLGYHIMTCLANEIIAEFPTTDTTGFQAFWQNRKYKLPDSSFWEQ